MKAYALGFAVAAGLAGMFGACGGSYCDYVASPKCPNDPKGDSQLVANCRTQYNNCANDPVCKKCLGKLQAFNDCYYNNTVCDQVTQREDATASAAARAAKCTGLSNDYNACKAGN